MEIREAAVIGLTMGAGIVEVFASAGDVDAAMTLGCGYPRGPQAMLDDIGAGRAHAVLTSMRARYGDPAFTPAALLTDHAIASLAFHPAGSGQ